MKARLTEADFQAAADRLGVPVAAVKAVCKVEAPNGGFDPEGRPRILFEGHVFHRNTGGKFDQVEPTLSFRRWTAAHYAKGANIDVRNAREHERLTKAAALSRAAALMSASWGAFQILGENYATAGFATLKDFINAMFEGEGAQLLAFVEFVMHDRGGKGWKALKHAVATGDWTPFAEFYNGKEQAKHQYDKRLKAAFDS
ncbi:N-acetylmuramidase family protein [Variovorax paradoxus]|nr:N-acetylmuramidase family protein [Variovorax paradoxus]